MATRETTIKLSVSDNFSQQLRNFASAIDKADTETKQLAKSTQDAAKGSSQLASGLGQIAGGLGLSLGIAGVTAAIVNLNKQQFEMGAKMEQTQMAFESLTGSAGAAEAHLKSLRDFAAKTPFQFDDLVTASRRMHAFGFETEQVIPMLTDIGDAAAAMGASSDTINRITLAIGQMSSKGKVSAQEMLQLTEAGIPAWKYLAQSVGVTTAEVHKMTEKGLIPAEQAIQAILTGMREDFGGQMAKQADTAAGAMSNLIDKWEQYLALQGQHALPVQKQMIGAMDFLASGALKHAEQITTLDKALKMGIISQAGYNKQMMLLGQGVQISENLINSLNNAISANTNVFKDNGNEMRNERDSIESVALAAENAKNELAELNNSMIENKLKQDVSDIGTMVGGALGNENDSFIDKQAELRLEIQKTKDELQKYYDMQGQTITVTEEATVSTAEYALAQFNAGESGWKLAEAQRLLSENTDPDKQIQLEGAVLRAQVALEKANEKVGEYGTKMGTSSEVTLDFSGKIGDLEEDLGILEGAFDDNAAAHEEATQRILFGILQQRLAMDGWTDAELDLLTEVGEQWGIFDKDTVKALKGVDAALEEFNEGDINNTIVKLNAIFGFPDTKIYKIGVEYSAGAGEVGIGPTAPLPTTPGSGGGSTTTGGTVGQQALGGEYMVSRPTTFTAGEAGPEKVKIEKAGSGGGNNKGGVTQYNTFNISSPMDMEMVLSQLAVRAKENLN